MDRGQLSDLRRNTILWLFAELWIITSYLIQDPPHDAYDAAERTAFSYAMLVVLPGISAVIVAAWVLALRQPRR